ncbi:hypothetical protein QJS66_07575 [Kocuria rhizophila]|nr:hypothetical protein QJS66_07575 [Kocuria rhizophila]
MGGFDATVPHHGDDNDCGALRAHGVPLFRVWSRCAWHTASAWNVSCRGACRPMRTAGRHSFWRRAWHNRSPGVTHCCAWPPSPCAPRCSPAGMALRRQRSRRRW